MLSKAQVGWLLIRKYLIASIGTYRYIPTRGNHVTGNATMQMRLGISLCFCNYEINSQAHLQPYVEEIRIKTCE